MVDSEASWPDSIQESPGLATALSALARVPRLLVCCDYDGTLAPIVSDPMSATPMPEAVAALRTLSSLPGTIVAVISGRSLRDLAALSRLPAEVHLVGSHGTEFDLGFVHRLESIQLDLLDQIKAFALDQVAGAPGSSLEVKPASVAIHVRNCSAPDSERVAAQVAQQVSTWPDVVVKHGKQVIELSVVRGDKGDALNRLRHEHSPSATLFVGDDLTDESVFPVLGGLDVGIKVGAGKTAANYRLADPAEVVLTLARLQLERRKWLTGGHVDAIEEHSLLADGTNLALVSPRASICWMCYPNPDSAAVFAAILGDESAGHFTVSPLHGGEPLSQTYVPNTMTVRTRFAGLTVLDYLDAAKSPLAGKSETHLVRVLSGTAVAEVVFAPRPEFGQATVGIEVVTDGLLVHGGAEELALYAPGTTWSLRGDPGRQEAVARIDLAVSSAVLELRLGTSNLMPPALVESETRQASQGQSRDWVASLVLPIYERGAVIRSALTLRALCHRPTGGALAAATLGLPEWIGGLRNWDYRYVWLRDGSIIVQTLLDLGSIAEADAFIGWLSKRFRTSKHPANLHPLYNLSGMASPAEAALEQLPGYAGSRPVRVGNAAQGQAQLDVFGAICNLILARARVRGSMTGEEQFILEASVAAVAERWRQPDHGIWEIRDVPRHHTHSKMMCWVAVDRGITAVSLTGSAPDKWFKLRTEIETDVLENAWDQRLGTFVSSYERHDIDAAVLQPLAYGFPATKEQTAGTIAAVEVSLRRGSTVYRYRYDDGLPGDEGAMHICAAWLIEAYVLNGQLDDADELFSAILVSAGRTGLLSEQVDPRDLRGLGNHPQAYSHAGLILAALALDRAKTAMAETEAVAQVHPLAQD